MELNIFDIWQHCIRILFIFQCLICLRFIISNSDKQEFGSIWKWICCCNDAMNHVDCVIKRDIYLQKMHSCSKNIYCISFLAPLAVGQQAYVIARCPSCIRPFVCLSVRALTFSLNIFSSETSYWILMKFHRNDPAIVHFRIS